MKQVSTQSGRSITAEEILVSAGRKPNIEELDLDRAGVRIGKGGIEIDDKLGTNIRSVHAAGDVTGKMLFTHVAEYQGPLLTGNLLFPIKRNASYQNVSWPPTSTPKLGTSAGPKPRHGLGSLT